MVLIDAGTLAVVVGKVPIPSKKEVVKGLKQGVVYLERETVIEFLVGELEKSPEFHDHDGALFRFQCRHAEDLKLMENSLP